MWYFTIRRSTVKDKVYLCLFYYYQPDFIIQTVVSRENLENGRSDIGIEIQNCITRLPSDPKILDTLSCLYLLREHAPELKVALRAAKHHTRAHMRGYDKDCCLSSAFSR